MKKIETGMLEHQKLILEKVSHNKELFRKELVKSLMWLKSYEIFRLHVWLKQKFYLTHGDIIEDVFGFIAA
ncbi:MAG: hypothetical protein JSV22_09500 [Bacteroidales bacterium]|nr:MAG: hypothetical protein JSV22_09500 [Bacteroidales bacterium]